MEEARNTPLPPGEDDFAEYEVGRAHRQPQQQFLHPQPPQKVKLPAFWDKDPAAWFQLADAVFNRLYVQGSWLRYEHVLMSLPPEVLERVRELLHAAAGLADPYKALRDCLVELLTPNVLDQVGQGGGDQQGPAQATSRRSRVWPGCTSPQRPASKDRGHR